MLGSGLNLVTTVIGFGMSATFIVFVCARLICGRAARAAAGTGAAPRAPAFDFDVDLRADLDSPIEHTHSGLEPFVVAAIPTMKYSNDAFHSKDDTQCSICLGEYSEKEVLRIMPTCRHHFHLACIDEWLQKQTTCPICRISLDDLTGGKAATSPTHMIPEQFVRTENSVNRSPQWFAPIQHHTEGQENRSATEESIEVVIEIQQSQYRHGHRGECGTSETK